MVIYQRGQRNKNYMGFLELVKFTLIFFHSWFNVSYQTGAMGLFQDLDSALSVLYLRGGVAEEAWEVIVQ